MKRGKVKKNKNKKYWGIIIPILVIIIVAAEILAFSFLKPVKKDNNLCGPTPAGPNYDLSHCDKSCKSDSDCKYVCGCGAINKNEKCDTGKMIYDCVGLMQVKCIKSKCTI